MNAAAELRRAKLLDSYVRTDPLSKRRLYSTPTSTDKMTKVVPLRQIPTLRELYQRAAISAQPETARGASFPPSSTLLDRVSV